MATTDHHRQRELLPWGKKHGLKNKHTHTHTHTGCTCALDSCLKPSVRKESACQLFTSLHISNLRRFECCCFLLRELHKKERIHLIYKIRTRKTICNRQDGERVGRGNITTNSCQLQALCAADFPCISSVNPVFQKQLAALLLFHLLQVRRFRARDRDSSQTMNAVSFVTVTATGWTIQGSIPGWRKRFFSSLKRWLWVVSSLPFSASLRLVPQGKTVGA